MTSRVLTVLRTGPQALVTDLGRPGLAYLGVPRSGALDGPALRLANRLVGNPLEAAGLEVLLGGLVVRAESPCTVAVTGAPVSVRVSRGSGSPSGPGSVAGPGSVDGSGSASGPDSEWRPERASPGAGTPEPGRPSGASVRRAVGSHRAVYLGPGDRLELAGLAAGMRCYLAVSGGVEVPTALDSRSTDLLSGLGPPPLRDGERLPLGPVTGSAPGCAEPVGVSVPPVTLEVPVLLGPRHDWFDDPASALRAAVWTVGSRSNRIGLRLDGRTPLRRTPGRDGAELPSEPMLPGAVQVPPNGLPVIFLADGPTTGGYPVVGVVPSGELPVLAQARPGIVLRFTPRLAHSR